MLLEFKTKNYKSFADEISFSMLAAPKQKGLDYSVYEKKLIEKADKLKGSDIISYRKKLKNVFDRFCPFVARKLLKV